MGCLEEGPIGSKTCDPYKSIRGVRAKVTALDRNTYLASIPPLATRACKRLSQHQPDLLACVGRAERLPDLFPKLDPGAIADDYALVNTPGYAGRFPSLKMPSIALCRPCLFKGVCVTEVLCCLSDDVVQR